MLLTAFNLIRKMNMFWMILIMGQMSFLIMAQDYEDVQPTTGDKPPTDYTNLLLDPKYLKGSRWDVEKTQKRERIEVYHALELLEIEKVEVETMSIRVMIMLQQRWVANELNLPEGLFEKTDSDRTYVTTRSEILSSIWSPSSIFINSRKTVIAGFDTPNAIVQIYRNKTIVFRAKVNVLLGCSFWFHWYPLDYQQCDIKIESFAYGSQTVRYMWESPNVQQPIMSADISLFQYTLQMPMEYTNGTSSHWGRGITYPYVKVEMLFERKLGFTMIQIFVPTNMVIILSWFSFWLGLDAVPARVTLLITCLLTIVTMHSAKSSTIPPVNYIKMMDIWMVSCMAFVFLALCEFIVVKYMNWRQTQDQKQKPEKPDELVTLILQMQNKLKNSIGGNGNRNKKIIHPYLEFYGNSYDLKKQDDYRIALVLHDNNPVNDEFPPPYPGQMYGGYGFQPQKKSRPMWVKIDQVSRIVFPVTFLIFNCVYWPVLLRGSEVQSTD